MTTWSDWTGNERARWGCIAEHPFEDASRGIDFTLRLIREQGWTRRYACAAIEEYRKFCFLAVCAGHQVTPSAIVDTVWHLHLTYTRDYWERFGVALGRPLHHEPTAGGRAEVARFRAQYAETLTSYQRYFGPPPLAFWPPDRPFPCWRDTLQRFYPRRCLRPRYAVSVFALAATLVTTAAFALPANPLDWNGESFLLLYMALMLGIGGASVGWRRALRENGVGSSGASLEPLEIAYLAGGSIRAVDAGVADLLARSAVRWDGSAGRLVADSGVDVPASLHGLLRAVRADGRPADVLNRAAVEFALLRSMLQSRGLLLDDAAAKRARWLPAVLPAAVAVFGVAKSAIGMARGRPVGFLVLLTVITIVAGIVFVARGVSRSRTGDRALAQLRARHVHGTRAPRASDLPLAVALVGTSVLATTAWADYHRARMPASNTSSSANSDSPNSSSDSSDGGGGGCGGCGGGGD